MQSRMWNIGCLLRTVLVAPSFGLCGLEHGSQTPLAGPACCELPHDGLRQRLVSLSFRQQGKVEVTSSLDHATVN